MNNNTATDKKIESIEVLDTYLLKSLLHLLTHWHNENASIVSCCLKDGEKSVFATSIRRDTYWLHAERNAYHQFKALYGEPSRTSVFIITLSPCILDLKYRNESAFSHLMKELGITRIHFGFLDTLHTSSVEHYTELGFNATLTCNPSLIEMCRRLMGMFAKYDARINAELLAIKKELGDQFFSPILFNKTI